MDKTKVGLHKKFTVLRTDGQSCVGEKHYNCDYFVLDLTHDEFAYSAIIAYANSCKEKFPLLAKDLFTKAKEIRDGS